MKVHSTARGFLEAGEDPLVVDTPDAAPAKKGSTVWL